ncbi:hypothetical protein Tco_1058518 [Tanacetum coccineum]|uniref:Uncharacterized protein n=1 Tax=Tanacetum coccineum TaxID=301880 RepID=A0ABQ5H9D5_9ASTR
MPKQTVKTNGMGNSNGKRDKMPIWNNTKRVNHTNKFVPRAVLLQSSIVELSFTRPHLSTPVPTGRQNLSKLVPASTLIAKLSCSFQVYYDSDTDDDQDVIILPSYLQFERISSLVLMASSDYYFANVEAERLGLEFAQDEEELVFKAAKNSFSKLPALTTVNSYSFDIISDGASSLRYPHPSTLANEFAIGVPNFKDIYDNPGLGVFTSSSYDDEEPRADATDMSPTMNVDPTSTKRINSAHPSSLIIRDINFHQLQTSLLVFLVVEAMQGRELAAEFLVSTHNVIAFSSGDLLGNSCEGTATTPLKPRKLKT